MRINWWYLVILFLASPALAQRTEMGPDGRARFTEAYRRQLADAGFRPDGTGAWFRVTRPATAWRPAEVEWQSCGGTPSAGGPSYPRNPNPEPAPIRPAPDTTPPDSTPPSDYTAEPVPGPRGPAGPQGPPGPPGKDAELTAAQLQVIAEAVAELLKGEESLRGPRGPAGRDGRDGVSPQIDYDRLAAEVAELLREDSPPSTGSQWSHLVLVAPSDASYSRRLGEDFDRAKQHYNGLRRTLPPEKNVGPLPALVAYRDGTPAKVWRGLREVEEALSRISRGEFDQFLPATD